MSETNILREILLALGSRPDVRLFRNHTGAGWTGRLVARNGRNVVLQDARFCNFGLAPGSSDLIGWQSVMITPDMVGHCFARLLAIEVKARGRVTKQQRDFLRVANEMGAAAGVARSVEDALALLLTKEGKEHDA